MSRVAPAVPLNDMLSQLRARAGLGRMVAFKCDFFGLPQVAQDALYGIAGELEQIADDLEARELTLLAALEDATAFRTSAALNRARELLGKAPL